MDQLADGIVDRHDTLGVQLAERYVERPLSGSELAQAVKGEIDTLADADASVADEQQRVAGDIVALQEFLLDEPILLGSQRTGKPEPGAGECHRDGAGGPERAVRGAKPTPPSVGVAR